MESSKAVGKVFEIKEDRNMNRICNTQFTRPILLYFYSSKIQDSVELRDILKEYFEENKPEASLATVDADLEGPRPLLKTYSIRGVPSAVLIKPSREVIVRFDDVDPVSIYEAVDTEGQKFKETYEAQRVKAYDKINKLLAEHKVIIFLKGTAQNPECGFSEKIMGALREQGIKFEVYNVMSCTDDLRNWIKEYSHFPTVPQLFINGKIVGGLDITKQLIAEGKLLTMVPEDYRVEPQRADGMNTEITERLVLFISSDAAQKDQCTATANGLQLKGLRFAVVDVKDNKSMPSELAGRAESDMELPALYVDGKCVLKGADLVVKASSAADLKDVLDQTLYRESPELLFPKLLNMKPVMIFIKGTPQEPKCGFTRKLLGELDNLNIDFGFFNILQDYYIREKLKAYSSWNTYPQVYINGTLIGGLDIVKELIEEGEFQEMTKEFVRK